MSKYRVMVIKYGFADIEAESEYEAEKKAEVMNNNNFYWGEFGDPEVVETIDD